MTPRRFLAMAAVSFAAVFGCVWLWVLIMPMAFLDPEYPSWRAKQTLLAACDLGEVLVLGDSRAAVGLMPAAWSVRGVNLAVGGGEPIEALAALTRALRCPNPPKRVILSFDATHFTHPDLFWERTVRFGFLNAAEIATLRRVSHTLGDLSVYEIRHTDDLPSLLRDWMHTASFPSLHFASLVKGGGFLRWSGNEAALAATLAARGQYFFGTASGSGAAAAESHMRGFQPLPVLDWYFLRVLDRLAARGIPAVFLSMPVNEATAGVTDPAVKAGFQAWLAGYEARYSGFRVAGDVMPVWPNALFGDGFSHLNPEGASRFNAALAPCMAEAVVTDACARRAQAAPSGVWTVARR